MDALSKEANLRLKVNVVRSKFNLLKTILKVVKTNLKVVKTNLKVVKTILKVVKTNFKLVKTNFEHAKKYFHGVNSTRNRDPKLIAERKKGASRTRNRDFFRIQNAMRPPPPPYNAEKSWQQRAAADLHAINSTYIVI